MLKAFIFAFFATIAFGALFQGPKKILVQGGIIGAIGWVLFNFLVNDINFSSFYANFYATIVISLLGELCARIFKQPATVFNIPAIIPLVPGLGMYQGMYYIINNNDYSYGGRVLMNAGMDAAAIAFGIMLIAGVFRALKLSREHQHLLHKRLLK